jgi:hypothetical protein
MSLMTAIKHRDWQWVAGTLERYGNYLLLIGESDKVGEARVFEVSR